MKLLRVRVGALKPVQGLGKRYTHTHIYIICVYIYIYTHAHTLSYAHKDTQYL